MPSERRVGYNLEVRINKKVKISEHETNLSTMTLNCAFLNNMLLLTNRFDTNPTLSDFHPYLLIGFKLSTFIDSPSGIVGVLFLTSVHTSLFMYSLKCSEETNICITTSVCPRWLGFGNVPAKRSWEGSRFPSAILKETCDWQGVHFRIHVQPDLRVGTRSPLLQPY